MSSLLATTAQGKPANFWLPKQASTVAQSVDLTFDVITWICYFFFFAITFCLIYFMIKYRRKGHAVVAKGPTHNTPIEIAWTVLPLILVVVIFVVGMRGYLNLREAPKNSYEVQVTAQRWSWTFDHPTFGATQVAELTVPVGYTRTVTHDFKRCSSQFVDSRLSRQDGHCSGSLYVVVV